MMRIDLGLTDRAEGRRFDAARQRLLERLLAFADWLGARWQDGAMLRPDHPVTLQRYVLIQMKRHRWQGHPLPGAYAARMIGRPSEGWRLVDGITAVYRDAGGAFIRGRRMRAAIR